MITISATAQALQDARNEVIRVGSSLYRFADVAECFRQCREHHPEVVEAYRLAYLAYHVDGRG